MNSISIFAFLLCVALSYCAPADPKNHYTSQFDHINVNEIMQSKRLVNQYVTCVIDNTGCTPAGKTLRELLPDALKTNCAKCTDRQRNGALTVMNGLEKDHPEQLERVLKKFDPDRKLFAAFKKANLKPT